MIFRLFKLKIPNILGLSSAETKILVTVLSILIGLCTLAFFAHRNSKRLILSSEQIELAEDYRSHIKEVMSISMNVESGVRGFVITGDDQYLEPSNKAIADIYMHLRQLSSTPGIPEDEAGEIQKLTELVDQNTANTSHIIEVRRMKGFDEAIRVMSEGNEKKTLDEIRSMTTSMISQADARLEKLREEHTSAIRHFALTFYFLLLKIGVTVGTVVTLLFLYFIKRNKSEKVLKDSKELFHNVLDHTSSQISIKDLSGRFILINQSFEKAFGTTEAGIKGKTVYDLFPKVTAESIRNSDIEVIRKQHQIEIEELIPVDGTIKHFAAIKFPLFDANHIPYAVCSIATDETEKIQSEMQHREQMSRIMDLFNNAPCGYQATNSDGIIMEMNDTLLNWLGYQRHEIIGKMPSKNLISKETQHQFSYYFPKLKSGELKSIYDVEVAYVRKDGSKIAIVANSMGQYDEDGKFLYTRTSLFDISYRKRVEEVMTNN